ncbi:helix-turn-helix domain-containing protein [Leifsonia sp. H3M29-4]|uniref:helix-turn-helix domain-containing protein n=1 Tax=Salinibacterium metalliresistens TaxID=3031321 RepID=UPI0023DBB36A|nr:helix-turn-helix domain-containing protein [Salinibacterium metalliresistens]MDF1477760.1 helix-turn-helix domain-containing protein [Salinibacterium metalliresistens]
MTAPTISALLGMLRRESALLSVKDTAAALGITEWWVRQLINSGELRAINVGGAEKAARWRVDPEDLRAFIAGRENRARDLTGAGVA